MGVLVGYMRVSTKEQTCDLQQDALLTAGVVERYLSQDIASSSVARRWA
jgi:DNA invertase Pin-like site-specific DNA recombinase